MRLLLLYVTVVHVCVRVYWLYFPNPCIHLFCGKTMNKALSYLTESLSNVQAVQYKCIDLLTHLLCVFRLKCFQHLVQILSCSYLFSLDIMLLHSLGNIICWLCMNYVTNSCCLRFRWYPKGLSSCRYISRLDAYVCLWNSLWQQCFFFIEIDVVSYFEYRASSNF